jgi:hypothetical protein
MYLTTREDKKMNDDMMVTEEERELQRELQEESELERISEEEDYYDLIGEHDETNYDPYQGCDTFERDGEYEDF